MEITLLSPATLQYLCKVLLFASVLHVTYKLLLSNYPMHQFNRIILILGTFLSVSLPLISIHTITSKQSTISSALAFKETTIKAFAAKAGVQQLLSITEFVKWVYIIIASMLMILFIIRIFKIVNIIITSKKENMQGYTLVYQNQLSASSFFKYVFVNNADTNDTIIQHEVAHIQYKHSLDKLYIELLLVVFWWCVPLYYIKKELFLIHEYQADEKAANNNKMGYSEFLVQSLFAINTTPIVNSFFHHPIKLRIKMLHISVTTQNKLYRIFSSGLLFSVLTIALVFVQTIAFSNTRFQQLKNYLASHANQVIPISIWYLTEPTEETDKVVERVDLKTDAGKARMKYLVDNNMVYINTIVNEGFGMSEHGLCFDESNPLCKRFWPTDVYISKGIPRQLKPGEIPPLQADLPTVPKNNLENNFFDLANQILANEKQLNTNEEEGKSIITINKLVNIATFKKIDTGKIITFEGKDSIIPYTVSLVQPKDPNLINADCPYYKTGEIGLQKYLADNIEYPALAIKNKIQGKLTMEVTINNIGKVINVKSGNEANSLLIEEAKRVLLKMDNWEVSKEFTAANKDVIMLIPISFVL